MSNLLECDIRFARGDKGRRILATALPPPGRWPRVARWLALAHRLDRLVRDGTADRYADLARRGLVSRARVTQILNLLLLAPDIQEEILFLPRVVCGRDPVLLCQLQGIAREPDWARQRLLWRRLRQENSRKNRRNCLDSSAGPR
jgi:hypothetical protein